MATLRGAGLCRVGAEAVAAHVDSRGAYRVALTGVATVAADRFAEALDDLLSPLGAPRYVVPRCGVGHLGLPGAAALHRQPVKAKEYLSLTGGRPRWRF